MAVNLVNLEAVTVDFGKGPVLDGVSLGIAVGERIGVVGRNGGGKSTLLGVLAGTAHLNAGRVTHTGELRLGSLSQVDDLDPETTVRQAIFGAASTHEWASHAGHRSVVAALLGDVESDLLDRTINTLSGGQRRRVALAQLLTSDLDLLLLDEPTNHLDVEGVAWLAAELKSRKNLAVLVVTHDRWFLDEVCDRTWEVVDGSVEEYDGGYSAFVLAKAERSRQWAASEARRQNLLRKELAWLRRGAPARTSKPKFRIDAANDLIEGEPPPRDNIELLAFAGNRLGKTVFELHDIDVAAGDKTVLKRVNWNIGPGQRIGIVGVNGAGKTSLLRMLAQETQPAAGKLVIGRTVKCAYLSQHLDELDPEWRLLEAVERVALRVELGKGRELSASQLAERLGFGADAQWTPVGDLSGGERRRLQLTRLLMSGPNVLMLDEPTNDFDTETLAALEDLLDSFAGTLLVVSHDRYFLERVCEKQVGLLNDGSVRDLPGGVDEYLALVENRSATAPAAAAAQRSDAAVARDARKELTRLERAISKLDDRIEKLHAELATAATDYEAVTALHAKLQAVESEKAELEASWLEFAELA